MSQPQIVLRIRPFHAGVDVYRVTDIGPEHAGSGHTLEEAVRNASNFLNCELLLHLEVATR